MKLNKPGIYRIIGKSFELLADITGEAPVLRINSALLMNDLIQKGKFTVLDESSIEIQEILANPDAFVFFEYEYSEICKLPPHRCSIRGAKMPDITDEQFQEFTNRYIEDNITFDRGLVATKAYIMSRTNWTLEQIQVVLLQIVRKLKNGSL